MAQILQFPVERTERHSERTGSTGQVKVTPLKTVQIDVNINLGDTPLHAIQVLAANTSYDRFADRW